jgi:sugar lactone lactonase YvrE
MISFRSIVPSAIFLTLFAINGLTQSTLTGTITTYAGPALPISGAQAVGQPIDFPAAVVPDAAGGFYVVSRSQSRVYYVSSNGTLSIAAGTGSPGFSGDGGPATSAQLNGPFSAALDNAGNLFIADTYNKRIRKITTNGVISTVAGTGIAGFSGDGGPATLARILFPLGVACDTAGNLFIADEGNHRIRKVATGIISTVAGTGAIGSGGDGGPATSAQFQYPWGIAVDTTTGSLFIADTGDNRIRKVSAGGIISTVAGIGTYGFSGDGGPAISAQLNDPESVAVDGQGNLLIADTFNNRIRKVALDGSISTIAGSGILGFAGDGGSASVAQLNSPSALTFDTTGNVLIADTSNHRIRKVAPNGLIDTIAGGGTSGFRGNGGPGASALFNTPDGIASDRAGNVFIADTLNNQVRKISPDGVITTVAGTGAPGFSGDGGPASAAQLRAPYAVTTDTAGNLFISDTGNARVRKVSHDGIIATIAGITTPGFSGDGGPAILARLSGPRGLAVDSGGTLFMADSFNNRIRRVTPDGVISTIAGTGAPDFSGDGGPASSAALNLPWGLAVDASGNVYIGDWNNYRVRKVSPDRVITTVAGNGTFGFTADGNFVASAAIGYVPGLAVDSLGNILIADELSRIRKISPNGVITTVAGGTYQGFSGDTGPATDSRLTNPVSIALDPIGNLFIADTGNQRIRKVTFKSQTSFLAVDRGGQSFRTSAGSPSINVGYAAIQPGVGSETPSGLAIFGFRENNVLVTEAGVPASPLLQSGRIYAEINGPVNTGLAVANPNDSPALISFFFADSNGTFGNGSTTIPARGQIAAFLDQFPFTQLPSNNSSPFSGSFTFTASVPVAAVALRGLTNDRGEFLITTLPVIDLNAPAGQGNITFAHFADGGGWTTQLALVNPSDNPLTGTLQFLDQSGRPAALTANGQSLNTFTYSLAPRTSQKLQTSGNSAPILAGSVRVTPDAGSATPSGVAIFSFHKDGITVGEAGVPAVHEGTAFRLYAEVVGNFGNEAIGSIQTGLAVANTSSVDATVNLTLTRLDGSSTGVTGTITVPANGQVSLFLNQIPGFGSLPVPFGGILRLLSNTSISVVGLRGRYNERKEFLITTTPPVNESAVGSTGPLYVPHIADGGGFTTQIILFSGQPGQSSNGTMQFFSQSGGALDLTLQ